MKGNPEPEAPFALDLPGIVISLCFWGLQRSVREYNSRKFLRGSCFIRLPLDDCSFRSASTMMVTGPQL